MKTNKIKPKNVLVAFSITLAVFSTLFILINVRFVYKGILTSMRDYIIICILPLFGYAASVLAYRFRNNFNKL